MLLASISKHGSVNWKVDGKNIDIETIVRIQLFAESIAHYQSIINEPTQNYADYYKEG